LSTELNEQTGIVAPASARNGENVQLGIGRQAGPLGLTLGHLLGSEMAEAFLAMRPTGNRQHVLPARIRLPAGGPL
jgi:hypothetical protein